MKAQDEQPPFANPFSTAEARKAQARRARTARAIWHGLIFTATFAAVVYLTLDTFAL